ncbi:MAG: hypothetical protein ACOYL8_02380 [Patescibacteria group bacterium]
METHQLVSKMGDICTQINRLLALANDYRGNIYPMHLEFGGYLTILDEKTGKILLILACGIIPPEKAKEWLKFSQEQAFRLFSHDSHKTSYESRNEEYDWYAGSVRGTEGIYSFYGHYSDVNEAIATSVFYLVEPGCRGCQKFKGEELFNYYYNGVSERNRYVRPFLDSAKHWVGNIHMDSLFPK